MTDKYRSQAEFMAQADEAADTRTLSPEETRQTLHELRVHQIELEMQNEELRRAQAELDAARARYFDLYDMAPVGYCTIGEKGLIEEANLTAAKLLNTTRSEMIKQPWTRFLHKEDQDIFYRQRKQLLESRKPNVFELRMRRKDLPEFWARLTAIVVQDADQQPAIRIVISDITERKQEEEFRENVERIIRHDIKGPLISLFSMAQLLINGDADYATKDMLPQMLQGIRQIIQLIDAHEPLLQMEKGTYSPNCKEIFLQKLLTSIQNTLSVLTDQYRITFAMSLGDATRYHEETILYGEEFLIEDMLMNLTKNAIEASPPDGVVTVACQEDHGFLRLTIHNLGAVPESIRGRFFDKDATAGKMYGTGLGTYSAQLIAKAHGGRISFTTSEAEGTTVTVILPAAPRD
ncbi:MAG: PAS domain S-box [Solidesulfovibrio magneticus str. Maddingley MBC34]|uniref:histidine kinase n=1 Tax=Solidesulfovibrio magneticus str. Maddingley MBC34 TaxID=1206767 RepID=K6FMT0_9BACT|nr:MAG: PAS domain S-box [Solidesulfovibrio magneticus str. Maddingley MBC34]